MRLTCLNYSRYWHPLQGSMIWLHMSIFPPRQAEKKMICCLYRLIWCFVHRHSIFTGTGMAVIFAWVTLHLWTFTFCMKLLTNSTDCLKTSAWFVFSSIPDGFAWRADRFQAFALIIKIATRITSRIEALTKMRWKQTAHAFKFVTWAIGHICGLSQWNFAILTQQFKLFFKGIKGQLLPPIFGAKIQS